MCPPPANRLPLEQIIFSDSEGVEDTATEDEELIVADDNGRNRGTETKRNRRSLNFLATAVPFPEAQFLSAKPKMFLLGLQTACDQILASRNGNSISQLMDAIQGHTVFVGKITSPDDSLDKIAMRCLTAELNVLTNDFIYMICTIHLWAQILR